MSHSETEHAQYKHIAKTFLKIDKHTQFGYNFRVFFSIFKDNAWTAFRDNFPLRSASKINFSYLSAPEFCFMIVNYGDITSGDTVRYDELHVLQAESLFLDLPSARSRAEQRAIFT